MTATTKGACAPAPEQPIPWTRARAELLAWVTGVLCAVGTTITGALIGWTTAAITDAVFVVYLVLALITRRRELRDV